MPKILLPYCPMCGQKKVINTENQFKCDACQYVYYHNPAPTVGAIIIKNHRVLLGKRAMEPMKGYWDVPGGFMDANETPKETLKREMLEELGIKIEIGKFVGYFPDVYGKFNESTLNLYYVVTKWSGEIKPDDDVTEAKWFNLNKLPEIAFKNGLEAIEKYKSSQLAKNGKK